MIVDTIKADYFNNRHARDIVYLLDNYAKDPMGGGEPLKQNVKDNIVQELSKLSYAFSFLAYADGKAVGLINCFEGFSTFNCKPLINIHDIIVLDSFRGMGIAQKLLLEVEKQARAKACCKLTLEVLEGNTIARAAYKKFGFNSYQLDPIMGNALFLQKNL